MGPATRADRVMLHDPNATPNPAFPNLTPHNHRVIGPATDAYNCIAWACGDTQNWWQPGPKFYWPVPSDPNDSTIDNLLAALAAIGFAVCPDETPELGFEKIAVYATRRQNTLMPHDCSRQICGQANLATGS